MPRKAAAGTGIIRKKTVTRGGKEYTYWEARYAAGYDPGTGKQIQRSITDKTQKEVAKKLKEATAAIDAGTYTAPSKMTIGQWLDIWTAEYLGGVKPRTVDNYKGVVRSRIKPGLGAVKLEALTPHTVQSYYNGLSKEGLAPKTVKNIHGILHKALQQAVANGYIKTNPADSCILPRAIRKELKPLDEDMISAFLKAMPKAKNVTIIPATLNLHTGIPKSANVKRRVAGYARVSTDSDEQFTSYTAQVDYYTSYIKRNPNWEFVDVYTDEGISGVSTKNREGFNRMISDALAGKIDLIVTKSVSRFARNTVDSLTTVRKLKEKGVEVYFEKENIYTLDSKGELLITIMSSLAQEESRSISENVTWGQRKRFADGKVSMAYKQFLGYRKGPDGLPEIDPEQAEVVRKIYRLFMADKTIGYICKQLESEGIPTPGGKTKWQSQTVNSILTNEKYKGSALLQKTYTVDFLTKTMKVNEGEVPQYYVECSHPPIIEPSEWEAVQVEVARRKKLGRRHDCFTPFSGKVICGDCGGVYGSKIWHSNSKYRQVIWQCNRKFKNEAKCTTPHVNEEILKDRFLEALGEYMADPEERIEGLRYVKKAMTDTDFIDADIEAKEAELDLLSGMIRNCVMMNASATLTEQEYQTQYTELSQRYESAKAEYEALLEERKMMDETSIVFSGILFRLTELPEIPATFDESHWNTLVDHVTVYNDERIVFTFTDGTEIVTML